MPVLFSPEESLIEVPCPSLNCHQPTREEPTRLLVPTKATTEALVIDESVIEPQEAVAAADLTHIHMPVQPLPPSHSLSEHLWGDKFKLLKVLFPQ